MWRCPDREEIGDRRRKNLKRAVLCLANRAVSVFRGGLGGFTLIQIVSIRYFLSVVTYIYLLPKIVLHLDGWGKDL